MRYIKSIICTAAVLTVSGSLGGCGGDKSNSTPQSNTQTNPSPRGSTMDNRTEQRGGTEPGKKTTNGTPGGNQPIGATNRGGTSEQRGNGIPSAGTSRAVSTTPAVLPIAGGDNLQGVSGPVQGGTERNKPTEVKTKPIPSSGNSNSGAGVVLSGTQGSQSSGDGSKGLSQRDANSADTEEDGNESEGGSEDKSNFANGGERGAQEEPHLSENFKQKIMLAFKALGEDWPVRSSGRLDLTQEEERQRTATESSIRALNVGETAEWKLALSKYRQAGSTQDILLGLLVELCDGGVVVSKDFAQVCKIGKVQRIHFVTSLTNIVFKGTIVGNEEQVMRNPKIAGTNNFAAQERLDRNFLLPKTTGVSDTALDAKVDSAIDFFSKMQHFKTLTVIGGRLEGVLEMENAIKDLSLAEDLDAMKHSEAKNYVTKRLGLVCKEGEQSDHLRETCRMEHRTKFVEDLYNLLLHLQHESAEDTIAAIPPVAKNLGKAAVVPIKTVEPNKFFAPKGPNTSPFEAAIQLYSEMLVLDSVSDSAQIAELSAAIQALNLHTTKVVGPGGLNTLVPARLIIMCGEDRVPSICESVHTRKTFVDSLIREIRKPLEDTLPKTTVQTNLRDANAAITVGAIGNNIPPPTNNLRNGQTPIPLIETPVIEDRPKITQALPARGTTDGAPAILPTRAGHTANLVLNADTRRDKVGVAPAGSPIAPTVEAPKLVLNPAVTNIQGNNLDITLPVTTKLATRPPPPTGPMTFEVQLDNAIKMFSEIQWMRRTNKDENTIQPKEDAIKKLNIMDGLNAKNQGDKDAQIFVIQFRVKEMCLGELRDKPSHLREICTNDDMQVDFVEEFYEFFVAAGPPTRPTDQRAPALVFNPVANALKPPPPKTPMTLLGKLDFAIKAFSEIQAMSLANGDATAIQPKEDAIKKLNIMDALKGEYPGGQDAQFLPGARRSKDSRISTIGSRLDLICRGNNLPIHLEGICGDEEWKIEFADELYKFLADSSSADSVEITPTRGQGTQRLPTQLSILRRGETESTGDDSDYSRTTDSDHEDSEPNRGFAELMGLNKQPATLGGNGIGVKWGGTTGRGETKIIPNAFANDDSDDDGIDKKGFSAWNTRGDVNTDIFKRRDNQQGRGRLGQGIQQPPGGGFGKNNRGVESDLRIPSMTPNQDDAHSDEDNSLEEIVALRDLPIPKTFDEKLKRAILLYSESRYASSQFTPNAMLIHTENEKIIGQLNLWPDLKAKYSTSQQRDSAISTKLATMCLANDLAAEGPVAYLSATCIGHREVFIHALLQIVFRSRQQPALL